MGPTGAGMWLPYGVNEVIKIARYRPSCVFKAHRDGPWCPSMDEMSLYTLVVYLCVLSPRMPTDIHNINTDVTPFTHVAHHTHTQNTYTDRGDSLV